MSSGGGGGRSGGKKRSKASECVRVAVRCRPLNRKEKQAGRVQVVAVDRESSSISLRNPKADAREPPKSFTYDCVFPSDSTQTEVYETTAATIIESVMDGYNGTIFAYGQTGTGKTHTMEGFPDPPEMRGIIPNSFKHIFDKIGVTEDKEFLVRASYLEIYNEEIRDLLSKDPRNRLELKESVDSGVYVKDLTSYVVKGVSEIDHVMQAGKKNRSVGATLMNADSSRSHSIFTVTIECSEVSELDGEAHIKVGKLNLVDLAGSERQSKTGATGDRLREATKINLSLSALGNVISALVDGKTRHIPYRDSKLTRLLQDSLGGNTKTVMVAAIGPADYNYDETLSTLRYATRAKSIKNKPKINEDPKDAMLREFQEEIARLRKQLEEEGGGGGGGGGFIEVDGERVPLGEGGVRTEVVEKVVEKVVVEHGAVSDAELKEMQAKAKREQDELKRRAEEEKLALAMATAKTEEERERLAAEVQRREQEHAKAEARKTVLSKKLAAMEEKLLIGGQLMDKATKQEQELLQKKMELEEQRREEQRLAQELAEREEAKLVIEEEYENLRDEVEKKTKKLRQLWEKFQAVKGEIRDVRQETQRERTFLLDSIRDLRRQKRLRQLVLKQFIPSEELAKLEALATYDEDADEWHIPRLQFAGNNVDRTARSRSPSPPPVRPRSGRRGDPDVPMRMDRALRAHAGMDEDFLPGRVTEEDMPLPISPYLQYTTEDGEPVREKRRDRSRPSSSRRKRGKRPGTASRRGRSKRRSEDVDADVEELDAATSYPTASGRVGGRY